MRSLSTAGLPPPKQTHWLSHLRAEPSHARILGGSLLMLAGSGLVSAVNFGYNVAVARLLGPRGFGHAAAAVTLLMLASAVTLTFQLVCAKLIARGETPGAKAAVFRVLLRRAWVVGVLLGWALALARQWVTDYLSLPSPSLVLVLAAGVAFYVPLGVKRGGLQGVCAFAQLSLNFILEALVKCLGAILLISLGTGVWGAVGAISASVALAYFLPLTPVELRRPSQSDLSGAFRESLQTIVFFIGQVVINNVDILLVKHFFAADQAGLYAAVALVGRVLYMLSWSVVTAMFPLSAAGKDESRDRSVLMVPLFIVLGIALLFIAGLGIGANFAVSGVFGRSFNAPHATVGKLLMLYAASTGVYSLAVVLISYQMSRKLAKSGYLQLLFSGAIVAGIYFFHSSLREVVVVQLVLMLALLVVAAAPFLRSVSQFGSETEPQPSAVPAAADLRRIRRVTEAEVIAEFLRSELHHPEFEDRERFLSLVAHPDLGNETENALRRALLFRRRGTMWREIPEDTQWWEVELSESVLDRMRVFPRAQWRRLASGRYLLNDIVERLRRNRLSGRTGTFQERLRNLSEQLEARARGSSVLLIGVDEVRPFTILEGNHRMTAARLVSSHFASRAFRFYCGFSPRMTECCWYQTSLSTLWRYGQNRLKLLLYDREADIARLQRLHHATAADRPEPTHPGAASRGPENKTPVRQAS